MQKYPELNEIAEDISDTTCVLINKMAQRVRSEMPYKAQYVLEKVIQRLSETV